MFSMWEWCLGDRQAEPMLLHLDMVLPVTLSGVVVGVAVGRGVHSGDTACL